MVCLHFIVLCNRFLEPPNEMIDYQSHHYLFIYLSIGKFAARAVKLLKKGAAWRYIVPPPPVQD